MNVKFIYSETATKFLRNLHQLFDRLYIGQIIGGDFSKIWGLLSIMHFNHRGDRCDFWISKGSIHM